VAAERAAARGDPGEHALVTVHHLPPGVRRHAQRLRRDPGTFAALGHDYRADLLDFATAVYDLPATGPGARPPPSPALFDFIDGMKHVEAEP
jgi:hypothetical protein